MDISIVIPAYNEEKNIEPLYFQLKKVLDSLNRKYEIIFVDDGSTDRTPVIIKKIIQKDRKVRIISFQRNFEKAAALSAGFEKANGKVILTLDADLQDDPSEIHKFLDKINQGYDLVVGWRHKRKDSLSKKTISKTFNLLVRTLTNVKLHDFDCNFRAIRREVIKHLGLYGGLYRYLPLLAVSKGFKTTEIKVKHNPRKYGKSKYGIKRIYTGIFDLITINFLLSYTKKPLHLFGMLGSLFTFTGVVIGLYLLYLKYFLSKLIGNRPLLIFTILLIVLGIQFISIGLLGEMIVNISQKPTNQYIIKEEL